MTLLMFKWHENVANGPRRNLASKVTKAPASKAHQPILASAADQNWRGVPYWQGFVPYWQALPDAFQIIIC